jgi:hypothetical protein
VSSFQHSVS